MKIFLDTSSLFKLYHRETGTEDILSFFNENSVRRVYLAELSIIEFSSAVWKKCRKNEIDENIGTLLIASFDKDSSKFSFVSETFQTRLLARNLIHKYWREGVRTLDSIQLASVLSIKPEVDFFFTSDLLLKDIAASEGLTVR